MKRLAIILSLVSLLIGSVVTPAYSVQDKCLTTKKFKELDHRSFMLMAKNLSKYTNQAVVIRALVSQMGNGAFVGYWYGKGNQNPFIGITGVGEDSSKSKKRLSKVIQNDYIKAKVIILSPEILGAPYFSVCSATIVND
jgi:hypothetical protein